MKIILTQDVAKLGKKGDLVEVSTGYGNNFLLKKKLGILATKDSLNDLKLEKAGQAQKRAEELAAAKQTAEQLSGKHIIVAMKAGEEGKIFGSVSSKEIEKEAKKQLAVTLDKKKIVLKEPIRSLGDHQIKIKLHPKVTGELVVKVVPE